MKIITIFIMSLLLTSCASMDRVRCGIGKLHSDHPHRLQRLEAGCRFPIDFNIN